MAFFRRISLATLIILVSVSIFQDLAHSDKQMTFISKEELDLPHFEAVPVKVNPGDTVLSITEELQTIPSNTISVETILSAFESLNPAIAPSEIQIHEIYYFPQFQEQ
ncbi:hypothetical protein [Oceanobacillus sp. J11TS1]|uniref:hypothetical protein n=1 Tax=Oceanobacillus sp. J11TS1 TaxID=2807191 RepID=UPI001B0CB9F0|nr:hypothetical protein [Oceanobacillus sp. J11TS1]GIO23121.1 hypothetical protein J11TS1_17020 [Oceanobacillus sp. J11TS1]